MQDDVWFQCEKENLLKKKERGDNALLHLMSVSVTWKTVVLNLFICTLLLFLEMMTSVHTTYYCNIFVNLSPTV